MSNKSVVTHTGRATASIGGTVVAETDAWAVVEGNVYFPPGSIKREFVSGTDHTTFCPWKGTASYYTIDVDGKKLDNAAWYYPEPYEKATTIKDYVAFYKNHVTIDAE